MDQVIRHARERGQEEVDMPVVTGVRARRSIRCGALTLTAVAALAGCGTEQRIADSAALPISSSAPPAASSPTAPPSDSATPAPEPADDGRCTAATLSGEIQPGDAAAGNRYAKLVVTNTGSADCTLNGYSGLQLLDAGGQTVPTDLERTAEPAPAPVTLPPAGKASADLRWSVVPHGDEPQTADCEPVATTAATIPPNETEPITMPWEYGPVCGGGHMTISAFYAG
jgi:hypothetical protein